MLKGVKKGLKKKIGIKGKKGAKDEDDLFDPEQLEKLKRELEEKRKAQAAEEGESSQNGSQAQAEPSASSDQAEEWAKFKLLTAGVDAVVKQSSEGLGKIKETSFYQRQVTDPTNLWRPDKAPGSVPEPEPEPEVEVIPEEEPIPEEPTVAPEDVEPVELDDSLFDTTYLDAIAAGDIQLAYIPDSPTEEEGDDPFDTSGVADVCKRIEAAEKQAARQVNLGSAAEFLSGKAGSGTGSDANNSRSRPRAGAGGRARPRAVNLLGDFDNPENAPKAPIFESVKNEEKPDILNDILGSPTNEALPLPELDIFLTSGPSPVPTTKVENTSSPGQDLGYKDILGEFDLIGNQGDSSKNKGHTANSTALLHSLLEPEEDLDDEFAALAAESVAKSPCPPQKEEEEEPEEDDPFDTTFVEKVVEEKQPEPELQSEPTVEPTAEEKNNDEDEFDFDPRAGEPARLTPPHQSLLENHTPTVECLPALDPQFRAKAPTGDLVDHIDPRVPGEKEVDPFDTTTVKVVLPGRAELRLLEEELLNAEAVPLTAKVTQLQPIFSAPPKSSQDEDDFDFDPRGDEKKSDHPFDQGESDPHQESSTDNVLVPQQEDEAELDPFDTSCVAGLNLGPGQLELKLLASELVGTGTSGSDDHKETGDGTSGLEQLEEDFDFDPRGGEEPDPFVVVVKQGILKTEDIFGDHHEEFVGADINSALIPTQGSDISLQPVPNNNSSGVGGGQEEEEVDPFDTSAIEVIKLLPPSELKAIEGEILAAPHFPTTAPQVILKAAFSAPAVPQEWTELKPQLTVDEEAAEKLHLLEEEDLFHTGIEHKPLTPNELQPDFDPFDTSIAEGVIPGRTEIRILEEELQLGVDGLSGRRLSDPDFDPRGATVVSAPTPIHPATLSYVSKILQPTRTDSIPTGFETGELDPFDTSAADQCTSENFGGASSGDIENKNQQDLKALEAELL